MEDEMAILCTRN